MTHILVAYASNSGSTKEIAGRLGEQLIQKGHTVDVRPVNEVQDLAGYGGVVAGGLLYLAGWHPDMTDFIKRHAAALTEKKPAFFVTCMKFARTDDCDRQPFPVLVDPNFSADGEAKPSGIAGSITNLRGYLGRSLPLLKKVNTSSLAVFNGRLNMFSLGMFERLFVFALMAVTGMRPGDKRNWEAIQAWGESLDFTG